MKLLDAESDAVKVPANRIVRLNLSQNSSSDNSSGREAFETEWAPTIPIDQIHPSEKGIQKLIPKKRLSFSPNPKTKSDKASKTSSKPSNQGNPLIGRWGEAFALKEILSHYEKKYNSNFVQAPEGNYQLMKEGTVEIEDQMVKSILRVWSAL